MLFALFVEMIAWSEALMQTLLLVLLAMFPNEPVGGIHVVAQVISSIPPSEYNVPGRGRVQDHTYWAVLAALAAERHFAMYNPFGLRQDDRRLAQQRWETSGRIGLFLAAEAQQALEMWRHGRDHCPDYAYVPRLTALSASANGFGWLRRHRCPRALEDLRTDELLERISTALWQQEHRP